MVTNILEIKVNPFMRPSNGSPEKPEKILPWVSLVEMIKHTQFARNIKCIAVKDTLSRVRTAWTPL